MTPRALLASALVLALTASPAFAAGGGKKAKDSYFKMALLTATIIKPNGARGVLSVEAGIDAADPSVRDRAEAMQPRLRDAYALTLQTYGRSLPAGRAPDADYIAAQLQRETDRVVGKPGARLLLGTILVN